MTLRNRGRGSTVEMRHVRVHEAVQRVVHEYRVKLEALALQRLGYVGEIGWGLTSYLLTAHDGHVPPPADGLHRALFELLGELVARERGTRP